MPGIGVLAKIASTAGAVDRPTRTPPVGRHNMKRDLRIFEPRVEGCQRGLAGSPLRY